MRFLLSFLVLLAVFVTVKASFVETNSEGESHVGAEMVDSLGFEAQHTDRNEVMLGTTQTTENRIATELLADAEAEAEFEANNEQQGEMEAEAEGEMEGEAEQEQEQEVEGEAEADAEAEAEFQAFEQDHAYVELERPVHLKWDQTHRPHGVVFSQGYNAQFNAPFGADKLPAAPARRIAPLTRYVPKGFRGLDYWSELYQFDTNGPLKSPPIRKEHVLVLGKGAPPVKFPTKDLADWFQGQVNELQAADAVGGTPAVRQKLAKQLGVSMDQLTYRPLPRGFAHKLLLLGNNYDLAKFPVQAHPEFTPLSAYGGPLEVDAEEPEDYKFSGTAYPSNIQDLPATFTQQYGYNRPHSRTRL